MRIRPAQLDDFPDVAELIQNPVEQRLVFPNASWPFSVRQLLRIAQQRHELTVLTLDRSIVGFANLYDLTAMHAWIGNVIVDRTLRGKGLGRQLLHYMLRNIFEARGLSAARLCVFTDNAAALHLYESVFGFRHANIRGAQRTEPAGPHTLKNLELTRENYQRHTPGSDAVQRIT